MSGKYGTRPDEHAPTLDRAASGPRAREAVSANERGGILPGGYRLDARIGVGGMGEVWQGWCTRLHRPVAIKLLHAAAAARGHGPRLEREARALATLGHPGIVQVYDAGVDARGCPYLVLELLEGRDLARHVQASGPLGAVAAVELLLPVADALELAHRRGIVHRDLKPDNVFVCDGSEWRHSAKLLDFGIARTREASNLTQGLLGTPDYMAPEQIDLASGVTPAVDQWGLAITLFAVITDREPFSSDDSVELFRKIRTAPLPYPSDESMPPSLFRILARATRKEPESRFTSMASMGEALRDWLAQQPRSNPAPPSRPTRSEPPPSTPLDAAIRAAFEEPR